jgi:hypothetical protein
MNNQQTCDESESCFAYPSVPETVPFPKQHKSIQQYQWSVHQEKPGMLCKVQSDSSAAKDTLTRRTLPSVEL